MFSFRSFCVFAVTAVGLVAASAGTASAQYPNPIVAQQITTSAAYNPWTDHWSIDTTRSSVRSSYYDPYRGYVDPGSVQSVNRYVPDGRGGLALEQGTTWTSGGVPHGELSRTGYRSAPGVSLRETEQMSYDR